MWARLDLADLYCDEGRKKLLDSPDTAKLRINEAGNLYKEVAHSQKSSPRMVWRAALGRATCFEMIGERQKAIEEYQKLSNEFSKEEDELPKDGTKRTFRSQKIELSKEAKKRAEELQKAGAADFYKWLAEYKPPRMDAAPSLGLDPTLPPEFQDLVGNTVENTKGNTQQKQTELEAQSGESHPAEPANNDPKQPEASEQPSTDPE